MLYISSIIKENNRETIDVYNDKNIAIEAAKYAFNKFDDKYNQILGYIVEQFELNNPAGRGKTVAFEDIRLENAYEHMREFMEV